MLLSWLMGIWAWGEVVGRMITVWVQERLKESRYFWGICELLGRWNILRCVWDLKRHWCHDMCHTKPVQSVQIVNNGFMWLGYLKLNRYNSSKNKGPHFKQSSRNFTGNSPVSHQIYYLYQKCLDHERESCWQFFQKNEQKEPKPVMPTSDSM